MEDSDDPVRFVLVGTERGVVRHVQVLMLPIYEELAIEKAEKMASDNKRKGVKVTVWDATLEKPIYVTR